MSRWDPMDSRQQPTETCPKCHSYLNLDGTCGGACAREAWMREQLAETAREAEQIRRERR